MAEELVPRRAFGRIGLGGFHLGKAPSTAAAVRIVHEAIDAGVNFLDREQHGFPSQQELAL